MATKLGKCTHKYMNITDKKHFLTRYLVQKIPQMFLSTVVQCLKGQSDFVVDFSWQEEYTCIILFLSIEQFKESVRNSNYYFFTHFIISVILHLVSNIYLTLYFPTIVLNLFISIVSNCLVLHVSVLCIITVPTLQYCSQD